MINAQFTRPTAVMLSAVWTLAALLAAVAFAVSAVAGEPGREGGRGARPTNGQATGAETVDRPLASPMLRQPRFSISKDKLD